MKCTTCGLDIKTDCFTALIGKDRLFFHLRCKPVFYYHQYEKPPEKEIINGREWL